MREIAVVRTSVRKFVKIVPCSLLSQSGQVLMMTQYT